MNKQIFAIAQNTFTELVRHKIFNIILVFILIILCTIGFLTELSPGAEKRVILDIGYVSIEILLLLTISLGVALVTFEEKELRTVWLILVKPVARYKYFVGKFLGISMLLATSAVAMTIILTFVCLFSNVLLDFNYLFVIGFIILKMIIMLSIALFFSIVSSSLITQITFTLFLYLLGYLSHHLLSLISNAQNIFSKLSLNLVYYIIPHFTYLNLRDQIYLMESSIPFGFIFKAVIYVFVYSSILLIISTLIFEKKEFK